MVPMFDDAAHQPTNPGEQVNPAASAALHNDQAKHAHLISCDACWHGQTCVDGAHLGLIVPTTTDPTVGGGGG